MINNTKSLKAWAISVLGLAMSMASLPAISEPSSADPLLSVLNDANRFDQQACLEVANEGFTVRECLHRRAGDDAATSQVAVTLPESMLDIMGAEMQWVKPLFSDIFRPGELRGTYTRWTKLGKEEMKLHAEHPFTLHVETRGGDAAFELAIADHELATVAGEVRADGSASLALTFAVSEVREFLFQDGFVIPVDRLAEKSSAYYMGCFIDTPAWDQYRPHQCIRLGTQPSTVSFQVFLPYTPNYVVWLQPSTSCSSLFCTVPISPGQTVYGYAYWVINGTPTGPVSAVAYYEYEPLL